MKHIINRGLYTALITPFKGGEVDYKSLEKLLHLQVEAGVEGVVVCGTTGESSTLSFEEKRRIISFSLSVVKEKIRVIAGVGSNNTLHAKEMAVKFSSLPLAGLLAVTPYYNKTNAEGLFQHFKTIAQSSPLPVILYNVPVRTGLNMQDETIARLSEIPNIIGIKDATGDLSRVSSLRRSVPKEFLLLSGDDFTALAFNASGGDGVISVVSNVAPAKMKSLQDISLKRAALEDAFPLQNDVFTIAEALFLEPNPIPVKYACFLKNLCQNEYRLPLLEPSAPVKEKIKEILKIC